MDWLKVHWKALAVAVVTFLLGVGIGAAGKTKTQTQTTTVVDNNTVLQTVTARAPSADAVRTVTVAKIQVRTVTAASSGSTNSGSGSSGGGAQTFHGDGSENIGTVNVASQSTLHWSCPSCANDNFAVTNSANDSGLIDVNALGPTSGQTVVDAGTYHDVSINTEGGVWTITITPGG